MGVEFFNDISLFGTPHAYGVGTIIGVIDSHGFGTVTITLKQLEVESLIDIKPGTFPNTINPKSMGVIPVGILSTADFDAPMEVPVSFFFEGIDGQAPDTSEMNDKLTQGSDPS